MQIVVQVLLFFALAASTVWMWVNPGFEPGIAIITSASTLIGSFFIRSKKEEDAKQVMNVSGNSSGIQSGRDINISK